MTVDRDDTDPEGPPMVKCPACNLWLAEDDFDAQRLHLMANHPGLVRKRLAEHDRWSGWEDYP
jgi:hypothetical protein